jgi:hypothetical protein
MNLCVLRPCFANLSKVLFLTSVSELMKKKVSIKQNAIDYEREIRPKSEPQMTEEKIFDERIISNYQELGQQSRRRAARKNTAK